MDLSKLSDSDLQALATGDLSKVSNEGLTHLHEQATQPQAAGDEAFRKQFDTPAEAPFWSKASWDNSSKMLANELGKPDAWPKAMNGALVGLASGAAPELQKTVMDATRHLPDAVQTAARLGTSGVATDAALGAAMSPSDRLRGFLLGGGTSAATRLGSKALEKIGDMGMQLAVGAKHYEPGAGNTLADEHVWGTRGMMRDQVKDRLGDAHRETIEAATLPTTDPTVNTREIGTNVYDDYTGSMTGRGRMIPSSADKPKIDQAIEFADDIRSRNEGREPVLQALDRRRAAGDRAYSEKTGDGRTTPIGELSQREQAHYSRAIKAADPTGKLAAADARYSSLKPADRALNEPLRLSGMGIISKPLTYIGGALPLSTVGQATHWGSKLADFLRPLAVKKMVEDAAEEDK